MRTFRSTTELSNRSLDVPQVCEGTRAPSCRRRRNRRCPGRVPKKCFAQGWFAASCCRDGSLVVIQLLWVQKTFGDHPHVAVFILILLVTYVRPSELLASRNKVFAPSPCGTSPVLVGWNRNFRNWNVHQNRGPQPVGRHGPTLVSRTQQVPDRVPNTSQWIRCKVSELCNKCEELSTGSKDTTWTVAWRPTTTLSLARSETT